MGSDRVCKTLSQVTLGELAIGEKRCHSEISNLPLPILTLESGDHIQVLKCTVRSNNHRII